jgi:hypothetical protein
VAAEEQTQEVAWAEPAVCDEFRARRGMPNQAIGEKGIQGWTQLKS